MCHGRMHDWACCTCDEHSSISRPLFDKSGMKKAFSCFRSWGCLDHSFKYHLIYSEQYRRNRSNIAEWSTEVKHNTYCTWSGQWRQKKEGTQKTSINNSFFPFLFISTVNKIGDAGAKSLSEALKSNTTLTGLNLYGEDKRIHTKDVHQQFTLFISLHFNRQQYWRHGSNITE